MCREWRTLRVAWAPVLSTGLTCAAPRQRSRDAEIAPAALSLSWLFLIRCVDICQEIYRAVLLVKRKERDCDGRQALGMEPCCYGGAG